MSITCTDAGAVIGPNAVTRMAEALGNTDRRHAPPRHLRVGGSLSYLVSPPTRMIPESDVARLHRAVIAALGECDASSSRGKRGVSRAIICSPIAFR